MDEDRRRLLGIIFLLYKRRNKRRNRSVWVHPLVLKRNLLGAFNTLFLELREYEENFFNYFRMSVSTFDEVLYKIPPQLNRQETNMRKCIKPAEMLKFSIVYITYVNIKIPIHLTIVFYIL